MPPKVRITRQEILDAAVEIVRDHGEKALNARAVAAKLGISTQPVFSNYTSVESLKEEVIAYAHQQYGDYIRREMSSGEYPPYKASGVGYIRFAMEERELFKLLFMRDRSREMIGAEREEIRPLIELIQNGIGLSEADAYRFHLEMWVYAHGIATMVATAYLPWKWEDVSQMLTDGYEGLKERYRKRRSTDGGHSDRCPDKTV